MVDLNVLPVPVIAAPMAGGPSTPELVIAAARAGGLGFLAGGYKSVDGLATEIGRVRDSGVTGFGVNLFVPGAPVRDRAAVQRYRDALVPVAAEYGTSVGEIVDADDDAYQGKIELMIRGRIPLVSFTFGLPTASEVERLHGVGSTVVATIADTLGALRAASVGVDALCVQGTEAGGHRATLDVDAVPNTTSTPDLVRAVASLVDLPLVAAGGIATGADVDAAFAAGAMAVQVGTVLLDSIEAGTKPTHRAALRDSRFRETVVTRAFSGRPARALRNRFTDTFGPVAPAEYPQIHHLTTPIRAAAAAADDPDNLNLWAGTNVAGLPRGSATDIITALWSQATVAAAQR